MKRRTIFKSLAAGVVAGLLASSALNAGGISVPPYFTLGSTLVALGRTVTSIAGLTLSGPSITGITGAIKAGSPASQAACADLSNAAASCATDATVATNITSGTLPAARLNGQIGSAGYYAEQLLFVSALPGMVAMTGTMANNGVLTLGGTGLPATTYANLYLYLPANAIVAGSAAGWYYTQCSNATACTVFNNTYTSGQPTIPGSPTPFATTGPGAYVGVITEQAYPVFTLPAGTMGARDSLKWEALFSRTADTNTSVFKHAANGPGGTNFMTSNQAGATIKTQSLISWVANRESQSAQVNCSASAAAGGCGGTSTGIATTSAVNFANQNTLGPTVQMGAATDFVGVEYFALTLMKSQ